MVKPKDPWDPIEKLSVVRREVFKIHPIYRQEYEAAFQDFLNGLPSDLAVRAQAELRESFLHSPQADEICQRWGLNLALHPDDELWDTAPIAAPILFADPGISVKVIPFGPMRFNPPSPENPWYLNDITPADITPALLEACDPSLLDMTPILREGRYLRVEIDLFKSIGQIELEIKDEVEKFKSVIHRSPKFEAGPQTIVCPIPFEDLGWLWKLRQSQEDQAYNIVKKPGRGPSRDIYLDEKPASGPVTIFQVWNMNKKEGKSPWKIAQELNPGLNPGLKTLTAKGCTRKKCPEKLDFQSLTDEQKENYNNEFCGKKDSCLIAKALLKNVRDAIAKAESLIASVSPIE